MNLVSGWKLKAEVPAALIWEGDVKGWISVLPSLLASFDSYSFKTKNEIE